MHFNPILYPDRIYKGELTVPHEPVVEPPVEGLEFVKDGSRVSGVSRHEWESTKEFMVNNFYSVAIVPKALGLAESHRQQQHPIVEQEMGKT